MFFRRAIPSRKLFFRSHISFLTCSIDKSHSKLPLFPPFIRRTFSSSTPPPSENKESSVTSISTSSPPSSSSSSLPSPSSSPSSAPITSINPLPANETQDQANQGCGSLKGGSESAFPSLSTTSPAATSTFHSNFSTTDTSSSNTFRKLTLESTLPRLPRFYRIGSASNAYSPFPMSSTSHSNKRRRRTYVSTHLSSFSPFRYVPPQCITTLKFPELNFISKGMSTGPHYRKCWLRNDPQALINEKLMELAHYLNQAHLVAVEPVQVLHSLFDVFASSDSLISDTLVHLMFPTERLGGNPFDLVWDPSLPDSSESTRDSSRRYLNVKRTIEYWCRLFEMFHLEQNASSKHVILAVEHVGQFFNSNLGIHIFELLETELDRLVLKYPQLVVVYGLSRESMLTMGPSKLGIAKPMGLRCLDLPSNHSPLVDALADISHGRDRDIWKAYMIHLHWAYISRTLVRACQFPPPTLSNVHSSIQQLVSILPGLESYINMPVPKQKLDSFICALMGFMLHSKEESKVISSPMILNQLKMLCQRLLHPGLDQDVLSLPDPHTPFSPFAPTPNNSPLQRLMDMKYTVVHPSEVNVSLDDVIGHSQAKSALRSLIQLPLQFPHHFNHGVLQRASSNGVLLYGPPGTGKTLLAKAIAKTSQCMFMSVTPSDVYNKFVGESEKYVKGLFEKARKCKPCIIFIDEVDALFTKRDFDVNGHRRDVLNEFCMQWEGMKDNQGIIVLGATNRPFDLDEAVLRRFARRVLVDLPSPQEQLAILRHHLTGERLHPDINLKAIVDQMSYYSGSDIKNVCVAASMAAIRELELKGEVQKERVLEMHHFLKSLKEVTASAHKNLGNLHRLREFQKTLGLGKTMEFGFHTQKEQQ